MLLTRKNYGKIIKGDGNAGLQFWSLSDRLKDLHSIQVWRVGKTRTIYDLISSIASCLPTQPHAQEGNIICPRVNTSLKVLKRHHLFKIFTDAYKQMW